MKNNINFNKKIFSVDALASQLEGGESKRKKLFLQMVVLIFYTMVILKFLHQHQNLGGKLIVALNSDSSVKKLKGKSRPINNESDRKKFLSYFNFIDSITSFNDKTPYNLIKN